MKMYEVFIRVVVSGRFWRKNGSVSDMVCGDTITETDRETHTHTLTRLIARSVPSS